MCRHFWRFIASIAHLLSPLRAPLAVVQKHLPLFWGVSMKSIAPNYVGARSFDQGLRLRIAPAPLQLLSGGCTILPSRKRLVARVPINSTRFSTPEAVVSNSENWSNSVPPFEEEDGLFEDLFPASACLEADHTVKDMEAESSGLVPQEWRALQEELAKTKKQKKREVIDLLERRAKERQERERMLLEKQIAGREVYRQKFFPRVLPEDTTAEASDDEDGPLVSEEALEEVPVLVKRAVPRNPRSALSNSTFEDMARLFSSGKFVERPAKVPKKYDDVEIMEVSGSKLLTAEEKALLKIIEVNFKNITSKKWNPLHTFAASGQINQLDLLLRRGSDIGARDMNGFTVLHWAAISGGAKDSIMRYLLLNADALVTATDEDGATVLHHATCNANSFAIKALLRHQADINACDNEWWTPLHIAVQSGRTDIINLLVARGADTTIKNKDGNTPLDLALSFGKEFRYYDIVKLLKVGTKETANRLLVNEVIEKPRSTEICIEDTDSVSLESYKLMTEEEASRYRSQSLDFSVISSKKWFPLRAFAGSGQINHVDMLLRHGVDANAQDMDGLTGLHWATICGRDSIVRFLLNNGADANATDKDGVRVLHYATHSANLFAIKALLRRNADINASDNEGWTPLHVAVQSGRIDVIKLLLSRGADTSIKNENGNTPLDIALSFGKGFLYYHVVKLLKKGRLRLANVDRPDLTL